MKLEKRLKSRHPDSGMEENEKPKRMCQRVKRRKDISHFTLFSDSVSSEFFLPGRPLSKHYLECTNAKHLVEVHAVRSLPCEENPENVLFLERMKKNIESLKGKKAEKRKKPSQCVKKGEFQWPSKFSMNPKA
jgi:hypothetical protein